MNIEELQDLVLEYKKIKLQMQGLRRMKEDDNGFTIVVKKHAFSSIVLGKSTQSTIEYIEDSMEKEMEKIEKELKTINVNL